MATKVVDASAVAAVIFAEPAGSSVLRRIGDARLVAPTILAYELANILLTKMRQNPADTSLYAERYAAGRQADIDEHEIEMTACIDLARRTRLTAYDAAYLLLARAMQIELVTLDKKLARAAAAA